MEAKIEEIFEFQFEGKTYITKGVNNKRLGIATKMLLKEDVLEQGAAMLEHGAFIIWQFLKNEDKKNMTFEYFEENLTNRNSNAIHFMKWLNKKSIEEINFLQQKNEQASQKQDIQDNK